MRTSPEVQGLVEATQRLSRMAHAAIFAKDTLTPEEVREVRDKFYKADGEAHRRLKALTGQGRA